MGKNSNTKPKLTDAERHKRFLEEARRAEASDAPEDFDEALKKVAIHKETKPIRRP
jgi:hypothetical protein